MDEYEYYKQDASAIPSCIEGYVHTDLHVCKCYICRIIYSEYEYLYLCARSTTERN
jgi:hypothetical protein